jgi:hypothetical protein
MLYSLMKSLILSALLITSSFSCMREVEKIVTVEEKSRSDIEETKAFYINHRNTYPSESIVVEFLKDDWLVIDFRGSLYLYRYRDGFREKIEVMVPYIKNK